MNIPYGIQLMTEKNLTRGREVLASDFLTQGPEIPAFENAFSEYIGSEYSVVVSNVTATSHLTVLAFGLKAGERVIFTPITFAATANCVRYAGGKVEFCDIESDIYLMDLNKLDGGHAFC